MKEVGHSGDDRISQLPECLIHHILMLLPIKDAVRTAIMSTEWRRHWRSIPQLVYGDGFTEQSMRNKLILKIYQSLLVHDVPVTKFVLAIPGLTPCDEIDDIIVHLSERGIQEFSLVLAYEDGHIYKLHSSLFTATLNFLKLEGCFFMVPKWFVGFSKLTSLVLVEVTVPFDFIENFLPNCPLLEELIIADCPGLRKLELDAPRLKVFFFGMHFIQKLCFNRTPLLSSLLLNVDVFPNPNLVALFASLPALQNLYIVADFLEVIAEIPYLTSRLPTPLHRLQHLHIYRYDLYSIWKEHVLVCLIMSSPNLHTLLIQLEAFHLNLLETSIGRLLEAEHHRGACLQHLRVFKIEDSLGEPFELELVRFILATAPQLSRLHIKPSPQLCSKKVTKFMKEVMQYERISEAQVIYDWNDEED